MTSSSIASSIFRGVAPELSADHKEKLRDFLESDAGQAVLTRLVTFVGGAESKELLEGRRFVLLMLIRLAGYEPVKPKAMDMAFPPLDDDAAWAKIK